MSKQTQAQKDQQEDLINDPNLLLAIAMVKSISALRDNNGSSSEGQEEGSNANAAGTDAAGGIHHPNEMIDISPILDIIDKLEFKKPLSTAEINLLTTCLTSQFSDVQDTKTLHARSKEYLVLLFYAILNGQGYQQSENYTGIIPQYIHTFLIEQQAYLKMCKESTNFAKRLLEILSKKDVELNLFNLWIIPISRIIFILNSKKNFDAQHFKYLKQSHLNIDQAQLSSLNSILAELAPETYSNLTKQKQQKQEEVKQIVQLPQNVFSEEDDLEKMLEYVPQDYATLATILQDHVDKKFVKQEAEELKDTETNKQNVQNQANIFESLKDHLKSTKIIDLYQKVIDKTIVNNTRDIHLLVQLESTVFGKVLKQVNEIGEPLSQQQIINFLTQDLIELSLKSLNNLKKINTELSTSMDVDSINTDTQSSTKEINDKIKEGLITVAKAAEILQDTLQTSSNVSITKDVEKCFQELLNHGEGFTFIQQLVKHSKIKQAEISKPLLSLANTLALFIFQRLKQTKEMNRDLIEQYMIVLTEFIKILSFTKIKEEAQSSNALVAQSSASDKTEEQKQAQSSQNSQQTAMKTRSQMRKEFASRQQASGKQQPVASELIEEVKQERVTTSATRKGKTPEKNIQQQSKQLVYNTKLNKEEVFKTCLSCLVMLTPLYLKTQEQTQMSTVLENIIEIMINGPQHVSRLMTGLLSEFTKPSVSYTKEIQLQIIDILINKYEIIIQSKPLTDLVVKLTLLFNNQELYRKVGIHNIGSLINEFEQKSIQQQPKQVQDMLTGKYLNRYIINIVIVGKLDDSNKIQIAKSILEKFQLENFKINSLNIYLHLLETYLIKDSHLKQFNSLVYTFITKLSSEKSDSLFLSATIQNSFEALIKDIQLTNDVYRNEIIESLADGLEVTQFINFLRQKIGNSNKIAELKPQIFSALKVITKINKQLAQVNQKAQILFNENTPDANSLQVLAQEYLSIDVDMNSKCLIAAKLEADIIQINHQLQNQNADQNQLELQNNQTIIVLFELLQNLDKYITQMKEQIIASNLNKQIYQNSGALAYLLNLISNADFTSTSYLTKVNQALSIEDNAEYKALIQQTLSPQIDLSNIAQQNTEDESQKVVDQIYNHCLSEGSYIDIQVLKSSMKLIKALYLNLKSLLIKSNQVSQNQNLTSFAQYLLKLKYNHSFVEFQEVDPQNNETILKIAGIHGIPLKDYMRLKSIDKAITLLLQTKDFLAQRQQQNENAQDEGHVLVLSFIKDLLQIISQMSSFKDNNDFKILNTYILGEEEDSNSLSKIFKSCDSKIKFNLWQLCLGTEFEQQILHLISGQDGQIFQVKKGGVQLEFQFNEKKAGRRSHRRNAEANDQQKKDLPAQNSLEISQAKLTETNQQVNYVSDQFLEILGYLVRDKESNQEGNKLSQALKQTLIGTEGISDLIINNIKNQGGSFQKLKKFILIVTQFTKDIQLKDQVCQHFYEQLIIAVTRGNLTEDEIINSIKLAELVSEDANQLITFIQSFVLPMTFEKQSTKFLIIDLMCQINQNQFLKLENGSKNKYSSHNIQEKRKKLQQEKLDQLEQRKQQYLIKQQQLISQQNDNSNPGGEQSLIQPKQNNTTLTDGPEGYKKDKLIKNSDQNSEDYMERPEQYCTFGRTKKEFSMQHWYFCYTCGLVGTNGCCAVCAWKCHKGHQVVYSKKSNFFCDCGEGGKCKSLQSGDKTKPRVSRSGQPAEQASIPSFPPGGMGMGLGMGNIFRDREPSAIEDSNIFSQLGKTGGLSKYRHAFEDHNEEEDSEAALIFRQFGAFGSFALGGQPPKFGQNLQIFSESSEDDAMREEHDEAAEMQEEGISLSQHLKSMRGVMQIINRHAPAKYEEIKEKLANKMIERKDSSLSSQQSLINPLEDPLSEISTPQHSQSFLADNVDSCINFGSADVNMTNVSQKTQINEEQNFTSLIDLIETEKEHFDNVFKNLIQLLDQQLIKYSQNMDHQTAELEMNSPSLIRGSSLIDITKSVKLCNDLTQTKRQTKEGTVSVVNPDDHEASLVTKQNLNLRQAIDSNKDGLLAITEKTQVNLYSSAQLYEDGYYAADSDKYSQEALKEGQQGLSKIDSHQLNFTPLQVKFNPTNSCFLSIAGIQDVEVVTINKQGKVVSKLSVDLMLQAFGKDLTIVNVQWLPGSQTLLAIATMQFIKIYNLAEDNISPIYNLTLVEGLITDFTFTKAIINSNKLNNSTFVLVSTTSGNIYYSQLQYQSYNNAKQQQNADKSMQMSIDDDSQIILTSMVQWGADIQIQKNCLSIHYSAESEVLIATFENSQTLIGKINLNISDKVAKLLYLDSIEEKQANLKAYFTKNGDNLVCFQDINISQKQRQDSINAYFLAYGRKQGTTASLPLLIKIHNNSVEINIIKLANGNNVSGSAFGIVYANSSKRSSKLERIIIINEDGSTVASQILNIQSMQEDSYQNSSQRKIIAINSLQINKSELPKEVVLPVNFFEKMTNLNNDTEIRKKLVLSGDIVSYFKNSKNTMDYFAKNSNQVIISESGKKAIKMILKMDNSSDYVLTGLRVRVEIGAKSINHMSFKVLNRVIKLKTKGTLFYDIPLCDIEVLYGMAHGIDTEFITEDPKTTPIRILCVEIFAQQKKDFNYKDKIKSLEKLREKQNNEKSNQQQSLSNEQSIIKELLKTSDQPFVSFDEKLEYIKMKCSENEIELIISLDVIAQALNVSKNQNMQVLNKLLDQLTQLMSNVGDQGSQQNQYIQAAIKRCIKVILKQIKPDAQIGNPLNYKTLKDKIITNGIIKDLQQSTITLDVIKSHINNLAKIYQKRQYEVFYIIQSNPLMIENLISLYLSQYQPSETLNRDVSSMLSLIMAQYTYNVNNNIQFSDNVQKLIQESYSRSDLSDLFRLLQPLLLHNDEDVQIIVISKLLIIVKKYAKAMFKILRINQLPAANYQDGQSQKIPILLIDFTPHLLKYLLNIVIPTYQESADIAYSLSYKLIKTFEANNQLHYKQKLDLSPYIVKTISNFIVDSLQQVKGDPSIYDTNVQSNAKFCYANLTFINLLLQQDSKYIEFKIKKSQLGLDSELKQMIIDEINNNRQNTTNITNWACNILEVFHEGYQQGKCSIRNKIEDGVATQTYEVKQGQNMDNIGCHLLRPIIETTSWKWHPLFIKTDGIFDLLDRKIPAQIILFVQFLISQLDYNADGLLNSISKISFINPSSEFLEAIGTQAIRMVLAKSLYNVTDKNISSDQELLVKEQIQQVQLNYKYDKFIQDFKTLYDKFIRRKQQLSFNMQFYIHSILEQTWEDASKLVQTWKKYIFLMSQLQIDEMLNMLLQGALQLNEDSAIICLSLCALALERSHDLSSIQYSYKLLQQESNFDLSRVFSLVSQAPVATTNYEIAENDVLSLINILLLGRNNKQVRISAAHFVKGLYESQNENSNYIQNIIYQKLQNIKQYDANSQEFLALLSYITNYELKQGKLQEQQKNLLAQKVYDMVRSSNQAMVAHPNLEIYATLQKTSSAFNTDYKTQDIQHIPSSLEQHYKEKKDLPLLSQFTDPQMALLGKQSVNYDKILNSQTSKKVSNPYLLEVEACSKCFEQRSQPYQTYRLQEIKSETKFTDSCMIIKFSSTFQVKQIALNIQEMRGIKAIKLINIFVNNKQGIDLAEMRNNWTFWKRAQQVQVEIGQKTIEVNFSLPIFATNILIEFQTVTLAKPIQPKQAIQKSTPTQKSLAGVDTMLCLLSKDIATKFSNVEDNLGENEIVSNNVLEKEQLFCPRCAKIVQGKHGICATCGENAQQCTFCRNINYEKPDAFLCNECGLSRYAKFDLTFQVKPGFATEKIENEDLKNISLSQIETQQQLAQASYTQLMKKRILLEKMIKRLNEGYEGITTKSISELYSDDCMALYQSMMKSLNIIKVLKQEIYIFEQGNQNIQEDTQLKKMKQSNIIQTNNNSSVCFSCNLEQLKATLSFIQVTAPSLINEYNKIGFLDLLYNNNLKMYSQSLQYLARQAVCSLVQGDQSNLNQVLQKIEEDLFDKRINIPAHLLSQNIVQEASLTALAEAKDNSAIADQILASFLAKIKHLIKSQIPVSNQDDQQLPANRQQNFSQKLIQAMQESLQDTNVAYYFTNRVLNYSQENHWIIQSLILQSSQKVREESREILQILCTLDKKNQASILKLQISNLNNVLSLTASASDQYFDLLSIILAPQQIKEAIQSEQDLNDHSNIFVKTFETLFYKIDKELAKLVELEQEKEQLGTEGFMPSISTGTCLSRLVTLVSSMIKESNILMIIIKKNVSLVIQSFLKIRKLNLVKNKVIQSCELEIEKLFKQLHSDREEEKEGFIQECITLISSGECDNKEQTFIFEEICKVIDPIKPEPVYLLNLNKAQSQEFFLRGKMNKNPYPNKSLGKTMGDIREKICKELELAEPELMELLIANKIVGMDLNITGVYEQVWWPYVCKQRNPDEYDIPNIEEANKNELTPMSVTYRLAGIDGEATEDRVESLAENNENEGTSQNIEKKYCVSLSLLRNIPSHNNQTESTNGIKVLIESLQHLDTLQKQKYLAEQLFKLISYAIKLKQIRVEIVHHHKYIIGILAQRLFESVGMQSSQEGKKQETLFDIILSILESLVVEMNLSTISHDQKIQTQQQSNKYQQMEIDSVEENQASSSHIELFIKIMQDACDEMIANHQGLDKTSKKIKAVSKILPFLINKEDKKATEILVGFVTQSINYNQLDLSSSNQYSNADKFKDRFYLERIIEVLESTPSYKSFIKDAIIEYNQGQLFKDMCEFLNQVSLINYDSENDVNVYKQQNIFVLKLLNAQAKNHPLSQQMITKWQGTNLLFKLYQLSQAKFKDKQVPLLAQEIIENFTNNNQDNDPTSKAYLKGLIDQQNDDKKKLAQKKRDEIMQKMKAQKDKNKFIKQIDIVAEEEQGPKCIVCLEGYTKKPTDILGMYVFSKKIKIAEVSSLGNGYTTTIGYTTVTHSNYIHLTCHQQAYKADANNRQPKKEWDGASIRNDHTKCNNLFPLKGGKITEDSYASVIERYFQILNKTIGSSDSDKVKVLLHDFKFLLKRFAYEESFSRDSQGGGPEHNFKLVPFIIQMIQQLLSIGSSQYMLNQSALQDITEEEKSFQYIQEKTLYEFLEQGLMQKKQFMSKLEEEKKYDEIEEEEKYSESQSSAQDDEEDAEEWNQVAAANNMSMDQITFQLTKALVFCPMPRWESYKIKFLSIILSTLAGLKDDKHQVQSTITSKMKGQVTDYSAPQGKKTLTISKQETDNVQMTDTEMQPTRRKRGMSDNKILVMQRTLLKLRPLLIQMRIIDSIKQKWDGKRLGFSGYLDNKQLGQLPKTADYLQRLSDEVLSKDNLLDVISDCDELVKEYKERILEINSVEEFLHDLGMLESVNQEYGSLENFVMTHF